MTASIGDDVQRLGDESTRRQEVLDGQAPQQLRSAMKRAAMQEDRLRDGRDQCATIIVEDDGWIRLDVQQHRWR
jgi:hypothetical protein